MELMAFKCKVWPIAKMVVFSWKKLEQNPILPNPGLKDFRDPKVIWHEQSQHWIMVVTEGQEIGFYRSKDLKQWG